MMGRPKGSGRKEPTDREVAMAAAYRAGKTLAEIGADHGGISRQRVDQILKRRFGIRASDGGEVLRAKHRRIARMAAKDERALKRWGCTWAQYVLLRDMRKPTGAFSRQKQNADNRGIAWELTLWQWWTVWQESGHWDQRGRGCRGYCMCRRGDAGPYALGNVFIQRATINSSEANNRGLPMGVRKNKKRNNFEAIRRIDGKKMVLGRFETPEAAHAAYIAADPLQVAA
jgi:hypothetical protein